MAVTIKAGSLGELLEEVIKEVETDGSDDKKESFIKNLIEDAKKHLKNDESHMLERMEFYDKTFKNLTYPIACATVDAFIGRWAEEHDEDPVEMILTILDVMYRRDK